MSRNSIRPFINGRRFSLTFFFVQFLFFLFLDWRPMNGGRTLNFGSQFFWAPSKVVAVVALELGRRRLAVVFIGRFAFFFLLCIWFGFFFLSFFSGNGSFVIATKRKKEEEKKKETTKKKKRKQWRRFRFGCGL